MLSTTALLSLFLGWILFIFIVSYIVQRLQREGKLVGEVDLIKRAGRSKISKIFPNIYKRIVFLEVRFKGDVFGKGSAAVTVDDVVNALKGRRGTLLVMKWHPTVITSLAHKLLSVTNTNNGKMLQILAIYKGNDGNDYFIGYTEGYHRIVFREKPAELLVYEEDVPFEDIEEIILNRVP